MKSVVCSYCAVKNIILQNLERSQETPEKLENSQSFEDITLFIMVFMQAFNEFIKIYEIDKEG